MKGYRPFIILAGLATIGTLLTLFWGASLFVWGLFWFFAILACVYQGLPIIPFQLLSVRFWNYKVFKLIAPPVAGLLMSQYWVFGASLAIKYLGVGENLLSYRYVSNQFLSIVPIAGAISGFLIQLGILLNSAVKKTFFAIGCFVLFIMALYTSILIIIPE